MAHHSSALLPSDTFLLPSPYAKAVPWLREPAQPQTYHTRSHLGPWRMLTHCRIDCLLLLHHLERFDSSFMSLLKIYLTVRSLLAHEMPHSFHCNYYLLILSAYILVICYSSLTLDSEQLGVETIS